MKPPRHTPGLAGFGPYAGLVSRTALALLFVLLVGAAPEVMAQESEDMWAEPVNLSQSGAATAPQLVTDADGMIHIIWQDTVDSSFVYLRGENGDWSEPEQVELPFGTRRDFPDLLATDPTPLFVPTLVADEVGLIHAFWLDGLRNLQYSAVAADLFADFTAWLRPQTLAEAALILDAKVDGGGRFHLSFIRQLETGEFPAGVYYRQSDSPETAWSDAIQLYHSPYFRVLSKDGANLNLDVTGAGDSAGVFVAWDNPSIDMVLLTHSRDGGQSWTEPWVVDRRQSEDDLNAVGPSKIQISATQDGVHIIWQAGHELVNCQQYHQWSNDSGRTWTPREHILDDFQGCPVEVQFRASHDDDLLILANGQTQPAQAAQPYLLAWNGSEWSEPQLQATLAGFVSPHTFRRVNLSCLEVAVTDENRLLAIGCGKALDEDIWLTSRPLGSTVDWFPPPAIWSSPVVLVSGNSQPSSLKVVADADGLVHSFWSQMDARLGAATAGYYARWDGQQWSQGIPIPNATAGNVERLAATLGRHNHLMVVWSEDTGDLYFSQVEVDRARIPSDWSPAEVLPAPRAAVAAVDIAVNSAGTIYVAYNLPVNEDRGIYVTRSDNRGQSWSLPVRAFDAQAAGWEIVGPPHLAAAAGDQLHLQWSKGSRLRGSGTQTTALYYSRSDDAGLSFHEAEVVVEKPVDWSVIEGVGERFVHRLWQEQSSVSISGAGLVSLLHQFSQDGGLTWGAPVRISGVSGPAALTEDSGGQLHLMQLSAGDLQYWQWSGNRWLADEGLSLTSMADSASAAVTSDGQLVVVYATQLKDETTNSAQHVLASTQRTVQLPSEAPTPLPSLTPTPTATPTVTPTPGPQPTPTLNLSASPGGAGLLDSANVWVVSAVPAGLLVLAVVARGVLAVRGRRG